MKILIRITLAFFISMLSLAAKPADFGPDWTDLDTAAAGEWWKVDKKPALKWTDFVKVPRDEVVAFALYTTDRRVLKLTAQLFPLYPDEDKFVFLELKKGDEWIVAAKESVYDLGWSAHFRIKNWDDSVDVPYRVRHGAKAMFEGLIRKNPVDKESIVVGSLSCNSRHDHGNRASIVNNLKKLDPDILFFAGDQTYNHKEHTSGWLEFGMQFREIMKDRPTVTIPDDHDIGQGNLWGEGGIKAEFVQGHDGGYFYPANYVNMVHRCQTWHLPDPDDATPIARGITVYYTSYNVGGVDFAIVSDRMFKSGPNGKIPQMGPRPDHVNDPSYDRSSVDVPGLQLLGQRQIDFLDNWAQDWEGADMKCLLSGTNFAGAVHLHGDFDNRLLADLDSNGWPQSGRNEALRSLRRGMAFHLAGDQHLAVVTKHGIDSYRDGPVTFVNPAIVNTIYGRWWWPEDESAGAKPIEGSPLPWTGDYDDGFGNKITMYAYANPDRNLVAMKRKERSEGDNFADGFGLVRFHKSTQKAVFECWPRFSDVTKGDGEQFPGWPLTFGMAENDGREAVAYLPELSLSGAKSSVVQVENEATGEILYTTRVQGNSFRAKVYAHGNYTVRIGSGRVDSKVLKGVKSVGKSDKKKIRVKL